MPIQKNNDLSHNQPQWLEDRSVNLEQPVISFETSNSNHHQDIALSPYRFSHRACTIIILHFWMLRRPSGKARQHRNMRIFQVLSTLPGGMDRQPKCEIIFARALSHSVSSTSVTTEDAVCSALLRHCAVAEAD